MRISLQPRAKLNLGLRILSIRKDGYHDLQSIFQEISLCDRLTIEALPGRRRIRLKCLGDAPEGPDNLVWKAASVFMELSDESLDISILLEKRIPARAGLGGGSSDAAGVLLGLARITGREDLDLFEAAAVLGSDVPFFINGGAAMVTGRGERIAAIPVIPFHAVLIHPPVNVSTPMAYSLWDAESDTYLTNSDTIRHDSASSAVWHEGKPFPHDLRNDFLPLLEKHIPEIAEVARFMSDSQCDSWGLSGSGPTFYALFRGEGEARCFSRSLRWNNSICRTADTAGASSNG
ncbi:MAG: 4-(cytidine 5'-diphospho)-2-C-methyl-D-erythritol kinase [Candidatus Fermentibacteraceae bacterium]|nr:4-(cytidine 5'-diphospho)-2-C-methyl-D-erythritol kinase [Candidatus Fermentibacteraceae bacterium]MBN2609139.1 4-(cytidine 5'-diphospho)-2-C-methyl-D-erythritol kinase [Candidatus Fermentibacteraceae bacterium]